MIGDWQTITVLGIVAIAVGVLLRGAVRAFAGKSKGCGGCGRGCGSATEKEQGKIPLVTLSLPKGAAPDGSPRE